MTAADVGTLRVERTVQASPEAVFDAWTNPEVLRRWWATERSWATPVAEVDLREGGGYTLTMKPPAADPHTVRGTYRVIERPRRLVYTWAWEEADGRLGPESTVTVEFIPDGARTRVVLVHEGLLSAESAGGHEHGWGGVLTSLQRLFNDNHDNEMEDSDG